MRKGQGRIWRLGRIGAVFLILDLVGCAGTTRVVAPPLPPPRRVPVKVSTEQMKPTPKAAARVGKRVPKENLEDLEFRRYIAALKKIPTHRRPPPKGEKVYPIDLNLKNADLVEAVRVLMETMGLNYMVDPRVKGTANVRASGKLSQSELFSILETLLVVNNATLIKADNVYKVVPLDKAATGAMPVFRKGVTPVGMTAQVVFLQQTSPKEMVTVLKPLLSAGGTVTGASLNSLILVDYPANLDKLLELIHLIDSRVVAQSLVRLLKVHNTDPNELMGELETIFSAYGALAQKGKFGVSFLPVSRLNSIMVLAASEALLERAVYWVRQLDLKSEMLANVHVYHVENYKARNLADLLTQAYGGAPAPPAIKEKKPEIGLRPLETQPGISGAGGVGVTGLGTSSLQPQTGAQAGLGARGLGTAGAVAGAVPTLKERAAPGVGAPAAGVGLKEGVRIIPDEENNLLVVVAPPYEWRIISELLRKLDIMPRQVLAEVLIAEVTLTDDLQYGIEWFLRARTVGGTPTGTYLETLPGTAAAFSAALGGFTFVAVDALNQFRTTINLLAGEGKVNVLASPQIMAANNQEARIQIGEEVPILTSQAIPLISQVTSYQTQTVQYRSSGIILTVKPQINANGMVTLEIAQEVSAPVTTTTGVSGSPTFTIRTAKTSLITGDNQTIVLGGLIREDMTRDKAGIPILRRLPLLGALFATEHVYHKKTELIVLITPHIVTGTAEGVKLTRDLKEKIGLEEVPAAPYQGTPPPPAAAPPPLGALPSPPAPSETVTGVY